MRFNVIRIEKCYILVKVHDYFLLAVQVVYRYVTQRMKTMADMGLLLQHRVEH